MVDRIDFYCANPDHQTGDAAEHLTTHEDHWAYCAVATNSQHRWQRTGGMALPQLKRLLAEAVASRSS